MSALKDKHTDIVEKYYNDIYTFCCVKCKKAELAADITHDTFVCFLEKSSAIESDKIRAWLFCTAKNKIREYFRKEKERRWDISISDYDIADEQDLDSLMTEEKTNAIDLSEAQEKILSILSPREQKVFIGLYIKKLSVKTVAEELNTTPNNIYAASMRVRNRVKRTLKNGELLCAIIIFKIFSDYFM